jgi:phage tail-like protein
MKTVPPQQTINTHQPQHSRRDFLTKTAILSGGILAFGLPFLKDHTPSVFAAPSRQTVPSGGTLQYLLELDGTIVGPLNSMESGFISGEILTYQDGNDLFLRKRLGRVKYEDIVLTCGANLSLPFYQWLAGTLSQQSPRKNGAIVTVNQNGQIIDRREFQNTLVKDVQFPALDGASNEPAYFKVTLSPERIRYQPASGQAGPPPRADLASLSASRFRLQIQGLEPACAFVQHIDSLVVSQEIISYRDGGTGGESKVRGGRLQVGNVVITLPQHQAGLFTAWFSDFVLQGQVAGNRKQGTLELFSPDGQSVLATVVLGNLGIFRMAPVTVGGASHVQIEMFCETMQLTQFPGSGSSRTSQQTAPAQNKVPFTQQKVLPSQPKSRMPRRRENVTPRLPQKP